MQRDNCFSHRVNEVYFLIMLVHSSIIRRQFIAKGFFNSRIYGYEIQTHDIMDIYAKYPQVPHMIFLTHL